MKTPTIREIADAIYEACAIHTTDWNGISHWECNHCHHSTKYQMQAFDPLNHEDDCLIHWAYRNLHSENIAPEDEETVDIPAVMI